MIPDKFTLQCNGGKVFTLTDIFEKGAINLVLDRCVLYQRNTESFQSSYDLFKKSFPKGFAWELTELIAGTLFLSFSLSFSLHVCIYVCLSCRMHNLVSSVKNVHFPTS